MYWGRRFRTMLLLAVVAGCSRETPRARSSPPAATARCGALPILREYERRGLMRRSAPDELRLELPIDLHSADCGAPDGYGHSLTLVLRLRRDPENCSVQSAEADSNPFGSPGGPTVSPWHDSFTVTGKPNLSNASLPLIELRDRNTRHALLLLPNAYYFYEDVPDGGNLKPELEPEGATDCCYGYSSSQFNSWKTGE